MDKQFEEMLIEDEEVLIDSIVESDLLSLGQPDEELSESDVFTKEIEESMKEKSISDAEDATTKAADPKGGKPADVEIEPVSPDENTKSSDKMKKSSDPKAEKVPSTDSDSLKTEESDEDSEDSEYDEEDEDDEVSEGLTKKQEEKLPEVLKKAILKKQGKTEESDEDSDEEGSEEDEEEQEESCDSHKKEKKESIDFSAIKSLVENEEGLTEEFKAKAALIFEAELRSQIAEAKSALQEEYETQLSEETERLSENLTNQVDSYLTYVAEHWVEENKVAVESSLRADLTENFMSSLRNLFEEHYIEVPESKVDLYDQLECENIEIKETLEQSKSEIDSLTETVKVLSREKIIEHSSRDLSQTERAKLEKLAEGVEFEDEEQFLENVSTLKSFYFGGKETSLTEEVEELEEDSQSYVSTETIVEEGFEAES